MHSHPLQLPSSWKHVATKRRVPGLHPSHLSLGWDWSFVTTDNGRRPFLHLGLSGLPCAVCLSPTARGALRKHGGTQQAYTDASANMTGGLHNVTSVTVLPS